MRPPTVFGHRAARGAAAACAAAALVTAGLAGAGAAQASAVHHRALVDPYSPSYHHPYRHGAFPTLARLREMRVWEAAHVPAAKSQNMRFGGGTTGVTTGQEKVYLVFYGSQWGTASTSGGHTVFSHDPTGEAPWLQEFFKGLGTSGEKWSGIMTQYCQGVAKGATSCPSSNTQHVAYPTGGVLAGVWADTATASPHKATAKQLGQQAVNAAKHFGNTTPGANRDAQYDILSATGTDPDGWLQNGFCAWHDDISDVGVASSVGDIAFTNMPYVTDAGKGCAEDAVNHNGTHDGQSMVNGHEYAETITDQNPPGGWTNPAGAEIGDLCETVHPFDLHLATGTFAVQTIWGNDGNGGSGACEASHAIVRTR